MYKRVYREKFSEFDNRKLEFEATDHIYTIPNKYSNCINLHFPYSIALYKIILDENVELPKKIKLLSNNNVFDTFKLDFVENNIIDLDIIFKNGLPIINPIKILFNEEFTNYNTISLKIKYINIEKSLNCRYLDVYRPYRISSISYNQFGPNSHYCFDNYCMISEIFNKKEKMIKIRNSDYNILTQSKEKKINLEQNVFKITNSFPKFIEIDDEDNNVVIIFLKEYYCFNREKIILKKPIQEFIENDDIEKINEISHINNSICPIAQDTILNNTEITMCKNCLTAFKKECLFNWIQRGGSECPICRADVSKCKTYLFKLEA